MNRDNIVRDLAASFGMADVHDSKVNGSKYDAATGTFYCGGITIPRSAVEDAKVYCEKQMDYYRSRADQSTDMRNMFLIFTVAYNSICMLKDNIER